METKILIPEIFSELFSPYRYKVFWGGRGGAKSHNFARVLLIKASQVPTRILCTREIQNSIKDSVHKLLSDLIKEYNLSGFTVTNDSIRHKNGSEFIFKGLNDVNNSSSQQIKSLEGIDICWVEEAQTVTKRSLDVLIPTIRKENSEIWFSFNRFKKDDPVWVRFCENPPPKTLIKKVNYYDNPFFPKVLQEEMEFCKEHYPEDYAHVWLGEVSKGVSGLVVKKFVNDCILQNGKYEFSKDSNVRPVQYIDDIPLHITADFNKRPNSWLVAHKTQSKAFFIDEIVIENSETENNIAIFCERFPNHRGEIIINGDCSGRQDKSNSKYPDYIQMLNYLKNFGYKNVNLEVPHFNPDRNLRVKAWNQKIRTNDNEVNIFIDPRCKWLIHNCENLEWKTGTNHFKEATSKQIEKNPELMYMAHPFDAASYMIFRYWPVTRLYDKPNVMPDYSQPQQNNFNHILNRG